MTSKEFIIDRLKLLVIEIPNIRCAYKYDEQCVSHNIEILPRSRYDQCEQLKEKQFEILEAFYKTYPEEMVVFFTEDDLIEIDNHPDFIVQGTSYQKDEESSWIDFVSSGEDNFDVGIKGVTGKVDYSNNYALAA